MKEILETTGISRAMLYSYLKARKKWPTLVETEGPLSRTDNRNFFSLRCLK